jgi:hypothetical protein
MVSNAKLNWTKRRSPNVVCVGDEAKDLYGNRWKVAAIRQTVTELHLVLRNWYGDHVVRYVVADRATGAISTA